MKIIDSDCTLPNENYYWKKVSVLPSVMDQTLGENNFCVSMEWCVIMAKNAVEKPYEDVRIALFKKGHTVTKTTLKFVIIFDKPTFFFLCYCVFTGDKQVSYRIRNIVEYHHLKDLFSY